MYETLIYVACEFHKYYYTYVMHRWLLDVHRTCPCCRADVCLDSDSDDDDDDSSAVGGATRTPYDELRPESRSGSLLQPQYNGALSSEAAVQQIEYMQSRNTLSHSISQLQMLRSRQASLIRERERLQEIHNGLCETRTGTLCSALFWHRIGLR